MDTGWLTSLFTWWTTGGPTSVGATSNSSDGATPPDSGFTFSNLFKDYGAGLTLMTPVAGLVPNSIGGAAGFGAAAGAAIDNAAAPTDSSSGLSWSTWGIILAVLIGLFLILALLHEAREL